MDILRHEHPAKGGGMVHAMLRVWYALSLYTSAALMSHLDASHIWLPACRKVDIHHCADQVIQYILGTWHQSKHRLRCVTQPAWISSSIDSAEQNAIAEYHRAINDALP